MAPIFFPEASPLKMLIQAQMFEKAGASLLHVSAGAHENTEVQFLSYLWPDAHLVELAARVKKVVNIPVCTVGKLEIRG
jgi:2,4-dienoyl-CoA reductase-like NADH-dependent reductase (Old Yellow Enzyme family)